MQNEKKPTVWILAAALVVCAAVVACILTRPKTSAPAADPSGTSDGAADTWVFAPAAADPDALRAKFPEYFDLPTAKGLEVYVWELAPDSYSCGVMPGTNREKTLEELIRLKGAGVEEMRAILSTYDIPKENIFIIPWQNPISSYLGAYWAAPEDEDPAAAASRRQAYTDRIRNMLLGGAAAGTKVAYAGWTDDSRMLACLNPALLRISSVRHLPVFRLDTPDDLLRFRETFRDVLTLDRGYDDAPSFEEATAGYDERFFAEQSVILAYVTADSGALRFAVREVVFDGSGLCLNVIQINRPAAYTADRTGWLAMAEISDAAAETCASFDAQIAGRDDPTGALFDAILTSPAYSSNPGDYLTAHAEERRQLLAEPKATLQYIFAEFLHAQRTGSGQTGLKGHIMRLILDELAPEARLKQEAETGQAYFDAWAAQAVKWQAQHGDAWVKENRPAMFLLLQMMQ